jgi:beta-xylosidase
VRWHDGVLYVVVGYVDYDDAHHQTTTYLLFTSSDPFSFSSWSDGLIIANPQGTIDGDLFWDDDGTVYMASGWGAIYLSTVDLSTGTVSPVTRIWNGTGGSNPEAPHIYKKDGYYYLLIAEGGSGPNHMVTIARSTDIWGPYESFAGNPILTNKGTEEYFQTVGHADFFTDKEGSWWGAALSTRSGSDFAIYPMGRETVLYPVSWPEGGWPVAEPVRGEMSGWHRPAVAPPRPDEIVVNGADVVDFRHGEELPENWVHYRIPDPSSFVVSPKGHENTLQLVPSASNLSGNAAVDVKDGLTFVGRRQTATLFEFSVDVEFDARIAGEEAGITVFISQGQHLDLSIIAEQSETAPQLRFRAATFGKANATAVEERVVDIPKAWLNAPIRLLVEAKDDERYTFSASSTRGKPEVKQMGTGGAGNLTGGLGRFVGKL